VEYSKTDSVFWISLREALQVSFPDVELKPFDNFYHFLAAFQASNWEKYRIILLMDEFSGFLSAPDDIRNQFLRAVREIKSNKSTYAIHSILACGTFSIFGTSTTDRDLSPFNVVTSVQNPYFTLEETQRLFNEFAMDAGITIDPMIIEDIWANSNGCVFQPNIFFVHGP
jgi:hypothetical protein